VIPTYGAACAGTLIAALADAASSNAPIRVKAHVRVTILYPPYLKLLKMFFLLPPIRH
jgi:hypothetical protein